MDNKRTTGVRAWASLTLDLLLKILRRLGSTAVIHCGIVCRPWRRAIISNALRLRPHHDRFHPGLIVFLEGTYCCFEDDMKFRRLDYKQASGPSTADMLALESLIDVGVYQKLLASRDGFVLLGDKCVKNLGLCHPVYGTCIFLSAAAVGASFWPCTYVVLGAGYDDDNTQPDIAGGSGVQVLAVAGEKNQISYQIFSCASGTWGPINHWPKFIDDALAERRIVTKPQHVVVSGSTVYCYVNVFSGNKYETARSCVFSIDTLTELTLITEVPEECRIPRCHPSALILATSDHGRRLSLIVSRAARSQIEVWVLVSGSQWTLHQTVDMQSLQLPNCTGLGYIICLRGFCPWSGCLFGVARNDLTGLNQHFIIGVDGSSPRLMETVDYRYCYRLPYEIDWSAYISKMKYF